MGHKSGNDAYRVLFRGNDCIWCGQVAQTVDHWPPLACTGPFAHGFRFPACTECNNIASTVYPYSFRGRANYVKEKIRSKYRKYLRHIEWCDEELEDLSPKSKREFKAWNEMKRTTYARIAWSAVAAFVNTAPDNDFVNLAASLGFSVDSAPKWFNVLKLDLEGEMENE